jgi:drug/metabolite transporter (DMT)-like permease
MPPNLDASRRAANTALGTLAILFWATTVALSRRVTQAIGPIGGGAAIYGVGGAAAVIFLLARPASLRAMLRLPRRYLFGSGALFVCYTVLLYWAIGHAASGEQTVEIGLVNYLWPILTIVFSAPVLGRRVQPTLWPGIAIALAGVCLAMIDPASFSPARLLGNVASNPAVYLCALAAAVMWGLYSNVSRLWAGAAGHEGGGVPLFIAASGVALLVMRLSVAEPPAAWSAGVVGEIVYMGLVPGLLAYLLWDRAVRRGHIIALASLSYFIPLLSTIITCWLLGVPMRPTLWVACGLLIAGAWLCSRSMKEQGG